MVVVVVGACAKVVTVAAVDVEIFLVKTMQPGSTSIFISSTFLYFCVQYAVVAFRHSVLLVDP